jgi:hypothetical protein
MGIGTIILAFVAVGTGKVLSWYLTLKWKHLTVKPKTTFFPKLCPMCLSQHATENVDEKSPDRQTANYIVAKRLEHWSASIPYCSRCKLRLDYGQIMAIGAGAICSVAVFILLPPNDINLSILVYVLFGYPAYAAISVLRKGVILKSGGTDHLTVAIRKPEYYQEWVNANRQEEAKAQAVPLAGGKGVWQR